jgi:hypothetical protein
MQPHWLVARRSSSFKIHPADPVAKWHSGMGGKALEMRSERV